jgi:glycosyltransferase involved in cell wall biosynthesis
VRVSAVIPTYNRAGLVGETVASALAQTRPPAEVVVVDDGSSDDTEQRLAAFGDRVRYVRQDNAGVSAARNRGVREATGDLVAFLDADDVWHPRKLERQLAAFAARPELGLVGTFTTDWPVRPFPKELDADADAEPQVVPIEELVVRNCFVTSSVLVRRDLLLKAGGFDTSLQGPEDFDLWIRVARSAPAANLPLALTGYRYSPGGVGKHPDKMRDGLLAILKKLDADGFWAGRGLLRRKAYSYFHYMCAYMYGASGGSAAALGHAARSLAGYPLPYHPREVRMSFARPRLFAVTLLRALRLKRPAPEGLR